MGIGRTAEEVLRAAGWKAVDEIPGSEMDKLGAHSPSAIPLFSAVSEIYEIYHHPEKDRWMLITNGGESFTINAPGILIASHNPERLDINRSDEEQTMVFTIGLDDKTVGNWLMWVGAQRNDPNRRPDRGFNYVS